MDNQSFDRAQKQVKKYKRFYKNLSSWLVMSMFLFMINIMTSSGFMWSLFPIVGWGAGVLFQALDVFGFPGLSKDWERRKLEEELQKIEMEDRLRIRYLELKEKEDHNLLDEHEELDLEELRKIKKNWDDSELV